MFYFGTCGMLFMEKGAIDIAKQIGGSERTVSLICGVKSTCLSAGTLWTLLERENLISQTGAEAVVL